MKKIIAILALLTSSAAWAAFPMDDFPGTATPLTGGSGTSSGSNASATAQEGEPMASRGHTVWWAWKAPSSDTMVFSTAGSDFDTYLEVYTGSSVSDLTTVVYNDDYTDQTSRVRFNAVAGTTYYICVAGYAASQFGNIKLTWGSIFSDDFLGSAVEPDYIVSGVVYGSNEGASLQTGEPFYSSSYSRTVWMPWKALGNGRVMFSTEDSDFDTCLAAYTGSSERVGSFAGGQERRLRKRQAL